MALTMVAALILITLVDGPDNAEMLLQRRDVRLLAHLAKLTFTMIKLHFSTRNLQTEGTNAMLKLMINDKRE